MSTGVVMHQNAVDIVLAANITNRFRSVSSIILLNYGLS